MIAFRRRLPARTAAAEAYRQTRAPALGQAWRAAPYCVVDLETTGLDPRRHEIISFAAVPIDEGRIRAGAALYGLARPVSPLGAESIRIHGILPTDLAGAPPLEEALDPLLAAIAGRVLVAHAAWVERGFLRRRSGGWASGSGSRSSTRRRSAGCGSTSAAKRRRPASH